ncbi:MAG: GNAT family N-acetyltransferase [Bacteroidota bacterium]
MAVTYTLASTENHLQQILDLQEKNLAESVSEEEAAREGFVTVKHDLELLALMNEEFQHAIALDGDKVVGYALIMERSLENTIPILVPMFKAINASIYMEQELAESPYCVMGQVCIDKDYRGKGVFKGLYDELILQVKPYFAFLITEIDARNTRSLRAHEKLDFQHIKTYTSEEGREWVLITYDLR